MAEQGQLMSLLCKDLTLGIQRYAPLEMWHRWLSTSVLAERLCEHYADSQKCHVWIGSDGSQWQGDMPAIPGNSSEGPWYCGQKRWCHVCSPQMAALGNAWHLDSAKEVYMYALSTALPHILGKGRLDLGMRHWPWLVPVHQCDGRCDVQEAIPWLDEIERVSS